MPNLSGQPVEEKYELQTLKLGSFFLSSSSLPGASSVGALKWEKFATFELAYMWNNPVGEGRGGGGL